MVSINSPDYRSWIMSRIQSKNTKPELIVRFTLHKLGMRYRLHSKNLPGKPDIVLTKHKVVIFVHGCFWHSHKPCKIAKQPKSNQEYWKPKLERNTQRFQEVSETLEKMGWRVAVIWECEALNSSLLCQRIVQIFPDVKSLKHIPEGEPYASIL